jgi:hypothetical protein
MRLERRPDRDPVAAGELRGVERVVGAGHVAQERVALGVAVQVVEALEVSRSSTARQSGPAVAGGAGELARERCSHARRFGRPVSGSVSAIS